MEVRQIELFMRTCEHGSINKAAAELRMSQPSLSRWLALLERDLGAQLFVRTRQGIQLTDAGKVLADHAPQMLRHFDLLREQIGNKSQRQINVAFPFSMQHLLTAPFAEMVIRDRPEISMRVFEGINHTIRVWMENGMLDSALIVEMESVPEHFSTTPILSEGLMLVGNSETELSLETPVEIADIHELPIILPGPPSSISSHVASAVKRQGYRFNHAFEADSLSLCIDLAQRGMGYTVMPYCALSSRLDRDPDLHAAPIRGLNIVWKLCVNSSRPFSTSNNSLINAMTDLMRQRVKDGEWKFAKLL
ncbi:MAG: LysR family transcriptional regulator [Maritimibacter sp.]|uniref:LysR family transcriptional regulator n=1 Tax=Maritimibacter sp. TaxID=2003363 RepID=UPI001D33C8D5|nr:LysR family transcriptional regulator [Maritimibacter sp.]MBL6430238.1 LysR family transcriptional regulator [Maritimibacter sp.]